MLVSNTGMATNMILLMMVILLGVMLLVSLMLIFLSYIHWHVPLLSRPTVHHDMLRLLVTLIKHAVGIVGSRLGDRGT